MILDDDLKEKYKRLNICGIHCLSFLTGIDFIIVYKTIKHNKGFIKIEDIIRWLDFFKIPFQYSKELKDSKYLIVTKHHAYAFKDGNFYDQTGLTKLDHRRKIQTILEFPYDYDYKLEMKKLIESIEID